MDMKVDKVEDVDLSVNDVVKMLEDYNMVEFVDFVRANHIDGRKLLNVSVESVNLWHSSLPAEKFILFIQDIKRNHSKSFYSEPGNVIKIKETNLCIESQYQTVSVRKVTPQENTNSVDEILKKITAPKSFLYRYHQRKPEKTSYVPMDATAKPKRFFRLSSNEYPIFDLKSRFCKPDNCADRGYYSIKANNRFYVQKTYKKADLRHKYKSLPPAEEFNDKISEDHFYEDLCYDEEVKKDEIVHQAAKVVNVKPCLVKIQELFQSFKIPFFRKPDVAVEETNTKAEEIVYENTIDSSADVMYDSIHVASEPDFKDKGKNQPGLVVEEYLEPVQIDKDYCDISLKNKDDSLLSFIMGYFESRFGIKRETNDTPHSEESEADAACDENMKWDRKGANMAARPLPVPVENEPYYMNIDRAEAENLLLGQPDGTFVLRPSSQPNHAYTLSVSCSNSVHNVGIRRRPDGRLSLGFARRGERSFPCITSLLRHHKRRRLLLVAGGDLIGATTLNDTPQYYQTPKSLSIVKTLEQSVQLL